MTKKNRVVRSLVASGWLCLAGVLAGCGGGASGDGGAEVTAQAAVGDPATAAGTAPGGTAGSAPGGTAGTAAAALTEAETMALAATQAAARTKAAADQVAAESTAQTAAAPPASQDPLAQAQAFALSKLEPVAGVTVSAAPSASTTAANTLTVRARGSLADGVGPLMTVRINGSVIASVEVRAATYTDYSFATPLRAADKVDVAFSNDAQIGGADRNLYIAYLSDGQQVLLPTMNGAVIDRGSGARAFDGIDTVAAQGTLWSNGALRLTWPAAPVVDATALAKRQAAVRFLMQASFGPTPNAVDALLNQDYAGWVTQQVAQPHAPDFVNYIQGKYALGDAWRPKGSSYTSEWVGRKFWATAANSPDQLRKRTAFALHQILMVSQADSNLYHHSRAYAAYLDILNKHAFGNFRNLLEDIALSPAMGIYLSHMRNRKEDAASGRMPDENFARELMQLFTIGLHELNADGTVVRNSAGQPVETYNNADVMALARVFTGWSWAFPDAQMTDSNFRWGGPNYSAAADTGIDLLPMKAYATQHSSAEKRLFAGKPWAVTIAANGTAKGDLKIALDTLFNHPNVGPFIGRQLIQRLVASNPSPAYVGRVAAVFANNGAGVRGDLAAVMRAVLLDSEARAAPPGGATKLREPVLRVSHWMRALGARSASGDYAMAWELESSGQRPLNAASVFSYFRPGYVPPNTPFASAGATAPEFQILNESTAAAWINSAEAMAGWGLGWTGTTADITVDYAAIGALTSGGNLRALSDHLDLLLLGGRMSPILRQAVLDAAAGATDSGTKLLENRARAAVFVVLASPEFATQP